MKTKMDLNPKVKGKEEGNNIKDKGQYESKTRKGDGKWIEMEIDRIKKNMKLYLK